jgi:hypothetical protein
VPTGGTPFEELPFIPLHGSASTPLASLLAWCAEIFAAEHEHTAAATALDVAAKCHHIAFEKYTLLLRLDYDDHWSSGGSEASGGPLLTYQDKGKGKSRNSGGVSPGDAEDELEVGGMDLS